ncbi:Cof-type HAD-IIB family hydrolase [Vagococcus humatus]|uniref:Cof-type HAD-IIB family hydrolase n=1 Tax=Vagococcus humatus TaxID=1889241 RepID=A0A3R9YWQ9_9ENTE|nr:Cof-type HAD-IIB family hydrolase [Vagococcus humatus]RST89125.1 Cof-type HAD-IIB family hydrolase [Vagococcus humatus]
MSIKLVAIDMDGTLLNSQKEISEKNQQVLKEAKKQGVKVVLCTGRPLISVLSHLETLGLVEEGDYTVTFNGGVIRENASGKVLNQITMSLEDVKEVYQIIDQLGMTADVLSDNYAYTLDGTKGNEPSIYDQLNHFSTFVPKTIHQLTAEMNFNKVVCSGPVDKITEKLAQVPANYREKYNVIRSGANLFEFVPKQVSKGNGLAILGDYLGITASEMMGLGDEENDLSMIEYTGCGVAMSNGSDIVKEKAQYITKTNDEDGVAYAVEKFVLG